jgi:metal-responsive CopG/Arc/MetJ family transcriptional regulator
MRGDQISVTKGIVCFRIDQTMDQRIDRILGPQYRTRSRFIRVAIDLLLAKEEAQQRLLMAQRYIQWG